MPKNNLREIILGIRAIWEIYSLTLIFCLNKACKALPFFKLFRSRYIETVVPRMGYILARGP